MIDKVFIQPRWLLVREMFHQQVLLGFRSVYGLSIVVQVAVVPDLELKMS